MSLKSGPIASDAPQVFTINIQKKCHAANHKEISDTVVRDTDVDIVLDRPDTNLRETMLVIYLWYEDKLTRLPSTKPGKACSLGLASP